VSNNIIVEVTTAELQFSSTRDEIEGIKTLCGAILTTHRKIIPSTHIEELCKNRLIHTIMKIKLALNL